MLFALERMLRKNRNYQSYEKNEIATWIVHETILGLCFKLICTIFLYIIFKVYVPFWTSCFRACVSLKTWGPKWLMNLENVYFDRKTEIIRAMKRRVCGLKNARPKMLHGTYDKNGICYFWKKDVWAQKREFQIVQVDVQKDSTQLKASP